MKNILLFILFALDVAAFYGCSCGNLFLNWGYNVSGDKVLYKNAFPNGTSEIPGADAKTFKIIYQPAIGNYPANSDYATDKNYAYYGGNVIPGSDGSSFTMLGRDFSKDKSRCYFHGKAIPQADPISFSVKDETYSTDKNNVYKEAVLLDNDASVFDSFDSGIVIHTAHAVSVLNAVIPMPPSAIFKHLGFGYFVIGNQVYFRDKPMQGLNAADLKPLDRHFSATARHVYYDDQIIKNADPANYRLLKSPYGKDNKHVFFFEKEINGADPASFEVLNAESECARDKNGAYHENVRIKNISVEDLANKKPCSQCSDTAIYFEGK